MDVPPPVTDWENYGGITRPVSLIVTPATYIDDGWIRIARDGRIAATVKLAGDDAAGRDVRVRIPALAFTLSGRTGPDGLWTAESSIPRALKRWSPDSPTLYEVRFEGGGDSVANTAGGSGRNYFRDFARVRGHLQRERVRGRHRVAAAERVAREQRRVVGTHRKRFAHDLAAALGRHRQDRHGRIAADPLLEPERLLDRVFVERVEDVLDARPVQPLRRWIEGLLGAGVGHLFDGDDDLQFGWTFRKRSGRSVRPTAAARVSVQAAFTPSFAPFAVPGGRER